MGSNNFLNELEEHHNWFQRQKPDLECIVESLTYYENFIPDFFSKNGEADGIKQMYRGIRNRMGRYGVTPMLECVDLNQGNHIYNDYLSGMTEFIEDIEAVKMTEQASEVLESFEEKIESAKSKDAIFIESVYNGKLSSLEEVELTEAVTKLEFLIDFIPQLGNLKEQCRVLNESCEREENPQKKKLLQDSIGMMYESVENYCNTTIKNIVTTYYGIYDKLYNPQPSVTVTPQFQLF